MICQHIASRMPNSSDVPRIRAGSSERETGLALIEHVAKTPGARVTVRELCTRAVDASSALHSLFFNDSLFRGRLFAKAN